jgi:hypothetical protein
MQGDGWWRLLDYMEWSDAAAMSWGQIFGDWFMAAITASIRSKPWQERAKDGFTIWRFRLEKAPASEEAA